MNALILGGTGWIGSYIVKQRPNWNWHVIGSKQVDLMDHNQIHKITGDYDVIVNCAGFYGGLVFNQKYQQQILYTNLVITANIWSLVQKLQPKKFINIGSACIYPSHAKNSIVESQIDPRCFHPSVEYSARAKHIQLEMMPMLEVPWEYLILSNVYGPGEHTSLEKSHFVGSLIKKLKQNKDCVKMLGTGSDIRDFMFINDAVEAVCQFIELDRATCDVYNISSGLGTTIKHTTEQLVDIVNPAAEIIWGDIKDNGTPFKILDNTKMKSVIGYQPQTSMKQGLEKTWEWFKNE